MCSTGMENTRAQKHAKDCLKRAKAMLGDGWAHVSVDVQWGLVSSNILALCLLQDETIPAENVRKTMIAVEAEARKLVFPQW